jgi:23S rRNA G2069 N7-methylase RlmK/C1962 C5-methylase RlmI
LGLAGNAAAAAGAAEVLMVDVDADVLALAARQGLPLLTST